MVETLKGRLGESDKDVALLGGIDSESKKKLDELKEHLKFETAKNEENGRAVECLEVRTPLLPSPFPSFFPSFLPSFLPSFHLSILSLLLLHLFFHHYLLPSISYFHLLA